MICKNFIEWIYFSNVKVLFVLLFIKKYFVKDEGQLRPNCFFIDISISPIKTVFSGRTN